MYCRHYDARFLPNVFFPQCPCFTSKNSQWLCLHPSAWIMQKLFYIIHLAESKQSNYIDFFSSVKGWIWRLGSHLQTLTLPGPLNVTIFHCLPEESTYLHVYYTARVYHSTKAPTSSSLHFLQHFLKRQQCLYLLPACAERSGRSV